MSRSHGERRELRQSKSAKKSKDGYITAMLLSVSISSFVFLLPNKAVNIYYSSIELKKLDRRSIDMRDLLSAATTLFLYCNYGMNFYAYTLPITKFRTELLDLLHGACTGKTRKRIK
jgi:hypothetical protein